MKIPELYEHKKPVFSLEIFPPKKNGKYRIHLRYSRAAGTLQSGLYQRYLRSWWEIWQTTLHVRSHPASRNSMGSNP